MGLFNNWNISKRQLWKKYVAFKAYITKGDTEISFIQQFFDYSKALIIVTALKVWFPNMGVKEIVLIIVGLALLKVLMKVAGGIFYHAVGLWKVEGEYNAKSSHITPFNVEIRKTLENIAEKVGATSGFIDL